MASALPQSIDGVPPSIVLIGVPNIPALERVINKLIDNRIDFSDFYEPDYDMGLSAVATVPVTAEQRAILQNYKLWNESTFNDAHVAQRSERRDNRKVYSEVGGSIPSVCTKREGSLTMQG